MSTSLSIKNNTRPWGAIFSIIMALFYDVSPIDLIPDLIPILGYLDDITVTILLGVFALMSYKRHRNKQAK